MSVMDMWTVCDRCGFDYKRRDCRKETTGHVVCKACHDGAFDRKNHPQNKPARRMREQKVIPNARDDVSASLPVPEVLRVIPVGEYVTLASTISGSFPIETSIHNGYVAFTGHRTFLDSPTWSPRWLFDGDRSPFDWCSNTDLSGAGPFFGQFQFPRPLVLRRIYVVPRLQNDNFPISMAVLVDDVTIAVASTTSSISQADGMGLDYTGRGIKVSVSASCIKLRLEFICSANCYIGEIELWAEEPTSWSPFMSVGY